MKQLSTFREDISNLEVVSLIYDDPRIKIKMISDIVNQFLVAQEQILYADFDLQFSSLMQNMSEYDLLPLESTNLHVIATKDPAEMFDSLVTLASIGGLVVIDSLNTLQRLYLRLPTVSDAKTANHRSAVLISAVQETCRSFKKSLLILNLTRSRPKGAGQGVTWEREIVGGRIIRFKSSLILSAREIREETDGTTTIGISKLSEKHMSQ